MITITTNDFGIPVGDYTNKQLAVYLREFKYNADAIQFIANKMDT
jgi:hypothetical protein